ncbi:condensation protein [Streptomyces boninensis]|uniref:condensation protein n=1 Tax=Streptomyces boninensis TaxID=2039455 RepID=UPI003B21602A
MTAVRPQPAEAPDLVPFPTLDEISLHCLEPSEPETVHIEVHLPGRLDHERLRTAFREAMARHPRILMRQTPSRWWHRRYVWQLTAEPDVEPVTFIPAGRGAVEAARERTMTDCPPLDASPPVRMEAVETEAGGTVLMVTINHTAMDGPSFLRVLSTAAEIYSGHEHVEPAAPPAAPSSATPPPVAAPSAPFRPIRIAGEAKAPATGNGMLLLDLPAPRRTPDGATVNDQLLVATCLMAARWNTEHGQAPGPVQITMPVDNRSRLSAEMPIGNGTRLTEVGFGPEEREDRELLTADPPDKEAVARLLRRTMTRTHALKVDVSDHPMGLSGTILTAPLAPVAIRGVLARTLSWAASPWKSTTLLSNIGRIPYPLEFEGAGKATAVWFSAPSRMPRGLAVTAASTAGRLHLTLRYSKARLDASAAHRLAALLQENLAACAGTSR